MGFGMQQSLLSDSFTFGLSIALTMIRMIVFKYHLHHIALLLKISRSTLIAIVKTLNICNWVLMTWHNFVPTLNPDLLLLFLCSH